MAWIPVDKDNLYREEVLAINTSHDMLVGYLCNEDGIVGCEDDSTELHEVTHYIPVTALVELVKEQHNNNIFITKEEAEEFSRWEKETGRGD